jgi:prolyl oligopeptidase
VYEDTQNPLLYNSVSVSEDGNWVFLTVQQGTEGNKVYYRPSSSPKNEAFKPLFDTNFTNKFGVVHTSGDTFFIYTNLNAPRYRLVTVRAGQTDAAQWRDLIPQTEYLLDGVSAAGGRLFAEYLSDATTRIFVYNTSGVREREIQLPTLGSSGAPGGWWEDEVLFYTFTSFTYPATVFKYTVATGRSEVFFQPQVAFNPADFETKQVFYTSKDGTRVPMFLVYKKGIRMDGQNPTYLYAYGGFNINLTPSFSATRMALVDMGAIFAMPNLRGGGEYGEEWHRAGMLEKKQNVFDDFIAAAEYLIRERYTSSAKLGIAGGSNGGLLVGACMTQRPDLFRVAIPKVGVLDMLRYHKFTVGWGWVPEYGSSEVPEQFPFLYKYSPYHNLRPNTAYPCTFIMTADHDDRVVPAHSFKFAAALQYAHRGPNPVLIRIETSAGHGAGKPTAKVVQETADEFAFFFRCVGVNPFARP